MAQHAFQGVCRSASDVVRLYIWDSRPRRINNEHLQKSTNNGHISTPHKAENDPKNKASKYFEMIFKVLENRQYSVFQSVIDLTIIISSLGFCFLAYEIEKSRDLGDVRFPNCSHLVTYLKLISLQA